MIIAIITSYLIGALPTGYLLARLRGLDIRSQGSGGTGATNILRTIGWQAALLTGLVDVGKGIAGVALGLWACGPDSWGLALTVIAAVAGHAWPVYIGFRGGKSVATSLGVIAWLFPVQTVVAVIIFVASIGLTRYVSLGSILGTLVLLLQVWTGPFSWPLRVGMLGIALIVIWRHESNIKRLVAGEENKLGRKKV